MSTKFGIDGKLYVCAAGIGDTPTWTEATKVKNLTLNLSVGEADVTTRGGSGWKMTAATLKEASIEFDYHWDPADAAFGLLRDAFMGRAAIGVAVMDGDVQSGEGLWADCAVTQFNRDENLEEAMIVKVTLKPTESANAPQWKGGS